MTRTCTSAQKIICALRSSIAAGGEFNVCPARNHSSIMIYKLKIRTFAWLCSSAGTVADKEPQPMFQRTAPLVAILLLVAVFCPTTMSNYKTTLKLSHLSSLAVGGILNVICLSENASCGSKSNPFMLSCIGVKCAPTSL